MGLRQHSSNTSQLQPYLLGCGYKESELAFDVPVDATESIPIVAFAHSPKDSRSACIAVVDESVDPRAAVGACRSSGAPLVFNRFNSQWQFWKQSTDGPKLIETISSSTLPTFFEANQENFAPDVIYRAKTWARFDSSYQLAFVDLGLMPLVEEEAGIRLSNLIERVVIDLKAKLGWTDISSAQGQWLLKSTFWLVAGKILRDKKVLTFTNIDLNNPKDVFLTVAKHYGAKEPVTAGSPIQYAALESSAKEISDFSNLSLITTDGLAYLYENALVTKETRTELGTHSTPSYLVDYVTGKLRPWITEIPQDERIVFEPACGHAAFLLSAMRLLNDLLPIDFSASERHAYLRDHLFGCDIDAFALEIGRLRLTLADVPNPNGWNLEAANMFDGEILARFSGYSRIVIANPPFRFASIVLETVAKNLQPRSVFGFVLPQSVLQSRSTTDLRKRIATDFEIEEISLFPDKVFEFSDAESAIVLARRRSPYSSTDYRVSYLHVRDADLQVFKCSYKAGNQTSINQSQFSEAKNWSFFIPDLTDVWDYFLNLRRFSSIADIGKGFEFRSRDDPEFPSGAVTESYQPANGLVPAFTKFRRGILTHELPPTVWVNLDNSVIRRQGHGTRTGTPQVLLNYARVSRGPWRLKAFLDREGHAVSSRFLTLRPLTNAWTLEGLWALCNSPVANAYAYAFSGKRDVLAGLIREMPVPEIDREASTRLNKLVEKYILGSRSQNVLETELGQEQLKYVHWQIDALILALYRLPAHLERLLLELFSNVHRRGVPFKQKEYFPSHYSDEVSLADFLSLTVDWEQTNERRVGLIHKKISGELTAEEDSELNHLQRLTDSRIRLFAPLPIRQLQEIRDDLKRRGVWEEIRG